MDDFSDDGFDDLNDNVLQELENNAIQSTQARRLAQSQTAPQAAPPVRNLHAPHYQPRPQRQQSPPPKPPQAQPHSQVFEVFDDDELDDTIVIDELAPRPGPAIEHPRLGPSLAQPGQQRWNQQSQAQRAILPPRPQYRPPPPRAAPIPILSQRYPRPPIPHSGIPHRPSQAPPQSQFVRPPIPIPRPYPAQSQAQALHAGAARKENDIAAALQARLSALEAELTAAKGEASILRSKYDKATHTHDAEINRLKKQNADQLARQEQAAEAARIAEQTATTELQFARQDLKTELGRTKTKKKDGSTTPKKSKAWGQSDGFDGLEILSSPSKGQAQRRKDSAGATGSALAQGERTPSKGKRKRPVVDSPSFALETESEVVPFRGATEHQKVTTSRVFSDALPFDFLRLVLDHSPLNGQPLTFDLFSRFAFPSQPSQTFAAIIFQKLPHMGSANEPSRLLVQFANLMIDMWQQCLSERYHPPIFYLAALLAYTLQLNSAAVAPHIISTLVPVCATTCRLVALPRFNSVDGNISDHPDDVIRQLLHDIDVTQSLCLLYMTALSCLSLPPSFDDADQDQGPSLVRTPQTEFWTTMELEFVMMMLSPKHPEQDWFGMLSLLWTSVLPTSIGPIPNPASSATYFDNGRAEMETKEFVANGIIDRVSSFLSEPPHWALPGSGKDVIVRLSVLKTLILFATSDFGAIHLANSGVALPRIVTVLCWGIDMLYDVDMSSSLPHVSHTLAPGKKTALEEHGTGAEPVPVAAKGDLMQLDPPPVEPVSIEADMMQLDAPRAERVAGEANNASTQGSDVCDEDEADESVVPLSTLLCQLIGQAMLLLHTLVTDPRTADLANINAKLAASYAGSQRYLITLARLNFAEEDLVLEKGIDAETVELAHELLELAVTPDEGEGLGDLFGL